MLGQLESSFAEKKASRMWASSVPLQQNSLTESLAAVAEQGQFLHSSVAASDYMNKEATEAWIPMNLSLRTHRFFQLVSTSLQYLSKFSYSSVPQLPPVWLPNDGARSMPGLSQHVCFILPSGCLLQEQESTTVFSPAEGPIWSTFYYPALFSLILKTTYIFAFTLC